MDVEKISETVKKAAVFDADNPTDDVGEAKAQLIPSVPDLEAIVEGMAELKSGLDTVSKK